jgi:hypothetical protein
MKIASIRASGTWAKYDAKEPKPQSRRIAALEVSTK